jgi:putative membrane protein
MKIIIHWILAALAIGVAASLLPGVTVTLTGAFILAIVLGIINVFIRPLLVLLTLPITILTLGIFSIVLNTLLIMLADLLVAGFTVSGFWWALLFGIVLSLINAFFHILQKHG